MAVSPLPPAPHLSPLAPVATVLPRPAIAVTPATSAANSGGAKTATAGNPGQPQLPMDKLLDKLNEQMRPWSTELQFEIDSDVHQVVVTIIDSKTGEKIRTIPSDVLLRIAKMIINLQGNAIQTSA